MEARFGKIAFRMIPLAYNSACTTYVKANGTRENASCKKEHHIMSSIIEIQCYVRPNMVLLQTLSQVIAVLQQVSRCRNGKKMKEGLQSLFRLLKYSILPEALAHQLLLVSIHCES